MLTSSATAAPEPDAADAFLIVPYAFVHPVRGVTVGWAYRAETILEGDDNFGIDLKPRPVQVQFRDAEGRGHVVVPEFRFGMYRATPPVFCGETAWTVEIPRWPTPVKLQPLPCPSASTVSFSFITDTQLDVEETALLVKEMAKREDAFTIHGGDIVNFGSRTREWIAFFRAMEPLTTTRPLVASAGNHDFFWDNDGTNL